MNATVPIQSTNLIGALFALAAAICFSLNDLGIKLLSDAYALHQVVLFRATIGLVIFLTIIMPLCGGWQVLRTQRAGWHLLRGTCVVMANTFLYLGLAALPIADAVAIFFVSPMLIAIMSILFLGETVGPRRWAAIIVGFLGVLVIVKPGTSAFQIAALFPIASAALYGVMHIIARRIGNTESAATMTFYILLSYIVVSGLVGFIAGDGRFADQVHPSIEFLLRAWQPVDPADLPIIAMLGVSGVAGGFLISQAYRLAEAAFAAPFEYVAMPLAIIWGITVFGTFPDRTAWMGIALILGSGLYLVWRETVKSRGHSTRR